MRWGIPSACESRAALNSRWSSSQCHLLSPYDLCTLPCGSCSGGSNECTGGHTNVHIPDIMVDHGGPAKNVRSWGLFFKFLTTCATVYEVLLPRPTLLSS